jgi:hypothetical protein
MRLKFIALLATVAATLAVAAPAQAIQFDFETGEGQVSKGEIQSKFGWNDHEFQRIAGRVFFRIRIVQVYRCPDGSRSVLSTEREVIARIVRDNPNDHVQGYIFLGYAGDVVERGDDCDGTLIRQRQELNVRFLRLGRIWFNLVKEPLPLL